MKPNYTKRRVLFVVDGCIFCPTAKLVIARLNLNLPIDKQISIINCSKYYSLGVSHPLIEEYKKEVKGQYPTLIIDGYKIPGANTQEEYYTFLTHFLQDEFLTDPYLQFQFPQDCHFSTRGLFKKEVVVCDG